MFLRDNIYMLTFFLLLLSLKYIVCVFFFKSNADVQQYHFH